MKNEILIREKERAKYTKAYFDNVYWIEDFPNKKNNKYSYNDPTHNKRFLFLTRLLVDHFKFRNFFDAGCGMGHIVRNLLKKGYDCKGVDISSDALKYFTPDLVEKDIVFHASLDKLPFKTNIFDLTFCSDVMEHIPIFDVEKSIKELIRVTKKYLVLTINIDHRYKYHPTILPRKKWQELFLKNKKVKPLSKLQKIIETKCKNKYPEYDFFIFQKNF